MGTINGEAIENLCNSGWNCNEYDNLCPVVEHKSKSDNWKLIYEENNDNFCVEIRGNTIVLHIGEVYTRVDVKGNDEIQIPPGQFIFFMTKEIVNMPLDVDGVLYMNPTCSNMGLLFFTLGHIDPGFHGRLTAALLNTTNKPIKLKRHHDCLYFVLHRLEKANKPYEKYHRNPQLTLDDARINQGFSLTPGFALTTQNFITRTEMYSVLAIIVSLFAVLAMFF